MSIPEPDKAGDERRGELAGAAADKNRKVS
jgi:hypothetical protein